MRKRILTIFAVGTGAVTVMLIALFSVWAAYRRPYRSVVEASGVEPALVYAVMKAESGFSASAKSGAGAVGIMQLLPATAEFVCDLNGIPFDAARLYDGGYNTELGCLYLKYLLKRFPCTETAIAAYNAGEGTVARWEREIGCTQDGALRRIPFPETERYLKKVQKFRKIYLFLYH